MGQPKPPDPMQTARAQQGLNREGMADAVRFGQVGQDTPWGSSSFSGEIGSPDRRQTVTLNPADQARLEQERSIKSTTAEHDLGGSRRRRAGPGQTGRCTADASHEREPNSSRPCRHPRARDAAHRRDQ